MLMTDEIYDIAVVGGGIAGYAAALTLKNLKQNFLWLGEEKFGKKLRAAEYVRNYPGFIGTGAELAALLEKQQTAEGIELCKARIDGVYQTQEGFLLTANEREYAARSVILCTGVETAGSVSGEDRFWGRGVSYCAVCDGALYRGKTIAAVVSSKEFAEEAEYLAGFARRVYAFCYYPNPVFRAENVYIVQGAPLAVEGSARVEKLLLKEGELAVDGVFFLKRSMPPSALVRGLKTESGRVVTDGKMRTNLKGLFAAGDVTGRPYQYIKSAGEGLTAAFSAREYLLSLKSR